MEKIKWLAIGIALPFVAFFVYAVGYVMLVPYENW